MIEQSHSLRTRLFIWYLSSLVILAVFFYLIVHILMLPYSTELFFLLLFVLAISGFFIIRRITSSLSKLTYQIQNITSRNLDMHIRGIKSKDEIGELAKAFNELLDRLNEAFKRERQFIADVAHELKTPLATQRSGLEIVLTQNRTIDDYKQAINEAVIENNEISGTLKNVLDLAWSGTPDDQKKASKFNVSQLIEDLTEIAIKMAQTKNINISQSIAKNIFVLGYKDKLARALLNIIDNAIKYTPAGRSITITLVKIDGYGQIDIKDTGQGINKKDLPHIFDRFFRGASTGNILGSGLGLAISKSLILLHKGDIEVKSQVGKGSIFTVLLPVTS